MSQIDIRIQKNEQLEAQRIDYNITGLKKNSWLGVFVNDIEILRFRTNVNGEKIGYVEPVPEEYHINLMALGSFSIKSLHIPTSGRIAGIGATVEDTDNEGLPNIGNHNIDLRYL